MTQERKPLFWLGSSKEDLKAFPDEVQDVMGHALDIAQQLIDSRLKRAQEHYAEWSKSQKGNRQT